MDNKLFKKLEEWREIGDHKKIIKKILSIPEEDRDYDLIGLLARAYNNDEKYSKAIEQLMSVKQKGETDSVWLFRLGYAYFYSDRDEEALSIIEKSLEINPDDKRIANFLQEIKEYLSKNNIESADDGTCDYWELHLETVELPENTEEYFDDDFSPAFCLNIDRLTKGLCYECTLDPFEDESRNMQELNNLIAEKGYEINGYGWESYLCGYIEKHAPTLYEKIDTDSESDTCGIYVYEDKSRFYELLKLISEAIRALYIVKPSTKKHEIAYLTHMYNDSYFPKFLVDKIKKELETVVDYIMSEQHTYEEIQKKFDAVVMQINDISEEFNENNSDIETVARESIGQTVIDILTAFDIKIDVETAIREREW